jgi:hypothetical protein
MNTLFLPLVSTIEPSRGWAKAYSNLTEQELQKLNVDWYYDYTLKYPFPSRGIEYVPFLWCDIYPSLKYENPAIRYFDELKKLPQDYNGYLLFLNEPDLRGSRIDGGQCERTPRQAAYMLKAVRELRPDVILIGPVVSHEDYLHGWVWLREFYRIIESNPEFADVKKPEIGAIHTYLKNDPANIVNSYFSLQNEFSSFPETAWVTEFAADTPEQAERMINFYKNDPRIERYAWFTARGWQTRFDLINQNGELTPLGIVYSR